VRWPISPRFPTRFVSYVSILDVGKGNWGVPTAAIAFWLSGVWVSQKRDLVIVENQKKRVHWDGALDGLFFNLKNESIISRSKYNAKRGGETGEATSD